MFVGRQGELELLNSCYKSESSQLVVLHGTRRVGKTDLLREFCRGKQCVFWSVAEEPRAMQLESFARLLNDLMSKGLQGFLPGGMTRSAEGGSQQSGSLESSYPAWRDAFGSISKLPISAKKLVVIDNFPALMRGGDAVLTALSDAWDSVLSHSNVMLVLCGASSSFLRAGRDAKSSPLFDCVTATIELHPLSYREAASFFPRYSSEEKALAYAVFGGIPRYLTACDPDLPLGENVVRAILQKDAPLREEAECLMHQEFREPAVYNGIIRLMAQGASRLNEIAEGVMLSASKTSVYLKNLMEAGFVAREFPIRPEDAVAAASGYADASNRRCAESREGHATAVILGHAGASNLGVRGGAASMPVLEHAGVGPSSAEDAGRRGGRYILTSNFMRFWYAFAFPRISSLEAGDARGIWEREIAPAIWSFAAEPFKRMCATWIFREGRAENVPVRSVKLGGWWNAKAEVDIVGYDKTGTQAIVGMCSVSETPLGLGDYWRLAEKAAAVRASKRAFVLFARGGFDPRLLQFAKTDDRVRLVSLEDLYR